MTLYVTTKDGINVSYILQFNKKHTDTWNSDNKNVDSKNTDVNKN